MPIPLVVTLPKKLQMSLAQSMPQVTQQRDKRRENGNDFRNLYEHIE